MKLWGLCIAVLVVALDQVSKYYVAAHFSHPYAQDIDILPFLKLVLVHNTGVSFGMLNSIPYGKYILASISGLITIILCYWLFTTHEKNLMIALSLIIAGAFGNISDRIRLGAVIDFIDFSVGTFHWPAFNVADSAIFLGVTYLCIAQLCFHRKDKHHESIS